MADLQQPSGNPALFRVRQVFQFLKAFAERRVPLKRTLSEQLWSLPLRRLPVHPAITIGEVLLGDAGDTVPASGTDVLLRVRRPTKTAAPSPPDELLEWLDPGWTDPAKTIETRPSRNVTRRGETVTELFEEDHARVAALDTWRRRWEVWAEAERPARQAMRIFELLYEQQGHIRLESERVELLLGDGLLRWQRPDGTIDHPVLLQRVELEFDPDVPEIRVVDADRAPELFGALLQDGDNLSPERLAQLRAELEDRGYHPLNSEPTSQFLKRLVQLLGPRGQFLSSHAERVAGPDPVIMRDPVLVLRNRTGGYSAAFERVLQDLEGSPELPPALVRLVGVEPPPSPVFEIAEHSPWGEPPDVLLSKPANTEQIQIARALEKHRAVLVQGPPGTGKSHTIANLIGHLVAHGKRVLVTSHATKALRVLRGQLVESLQPLCVAVLENDLEGRSQMEQAVRGILSRFTTSSPEALEREVAELAQTRSFLNQQVTDVTCDLRLIREVEFTPILLSGRSMPPSEAARWVRDNKHGNAWIPVPLQPGAPLPLSGTDLRALYASNGQLGVHEVAELDQGLPGLEALMTPHLFKQLVASLDATEPPENARYWATTPSGEGIAPLQALNAAIERAVTGLNQMSQWERSVVQAGHGSGSEIGLWQELASMVSTACERYERAKPALLEHAPALPKNWNPDDTRRVLGEMIAHMQSGGSLGTFALLLHGKWKQFVTESRVNDAAPSQLEHFRALSTQFSVEEGRRKLAIRWARQAEPVGLPAFAACGDDPEPALSEYVPQFHRLLRWWKTHWREVENAAREADLDWYGVRERHIAVSGPLAPFRRDVALLEGSLREVTLTRLGVCLRAHAELALAELEELLGKYTGPACSELHLAVRSRDADAYAASRTCVERLAGKSPIWAERNRLLAVLEDTAPGWASAVRQRNAEHAATTVPGDPDLAWTWRQFRQEINRRAALDERALNSRLEQLRLELRKVTADLIDRRAWLGQIRRTDLPARQALQGWVDTQRRIGKGTGKRAPQLQARARDLLVAARDAVPVWIMPLNRVAESFDPTKRFDVVIVDEASQSDVMGLLAWYLGDRIAVVGDHEQVSPLDVGQQTQAIGSLIAQHLADIPNAHLYDGLNSIYNLARQCFGGTIALREHFRCVPDIIDFSNHLSYAGEIRPLRNPAPVPRPHVVECMPDPRLGNNRESKSNLAEARTVVALLAAITEMTEYDDKTAGAITLLGDEQAGLIQDLAVRQLGAVELENRRFVSGNSAQFQGDERDIIFLSMVDVPSFGPLALRQTDMFKQRYNVAASRAKDQMWLVHSLEPARDLKPGDLRSRLIEHVRDPGARARQVQLASARAESPFEKSVIERLVGLRYQVVPQVWVGKYRIDMVVSSGQNQVALECDGDRFHGVEKIPEDMARQAVLERSGWRFVRIRGTRFYRSPDETMQWVVEELRRLGVEPAHQTPNAEGSTNEGSGLSSEVRRRAWAFMREWGWLPDIAPDATTNGGDNGNH